MFVSDIQFTFELLAKAMNLPENVQIVAVQSFTFPNKGMTVTIVSDNAPPEDVALDDLAKLGDAYRHPENYKYDPAKYRGHTRGYPDTPEEGPVEWKEGL